MKWIFGYGSRVLFYISTVHSLILDTSVGVKPIASIHDWAEVLPNAGWHKETNVEAMGVFWMLFTQDLLSVIELWRYATTTSKQQRSFGTYAFFLVSETANPIENQRISKHTRREIQSYRPGREEEMAVYAPSWLLEEQQNSLKFKAAEPEREKKRWQTMFLHGCCCWRSITLPNVKILCWVQNPFLQNRVFGETKLLLNAFLKLLRYEIHIQKP
jgi:hypothetical protein